MLLCQRLITRTTVDIPDAVFRRVKAVAALRGATMKQLIVDAVERETRTVVSAPARSTRRLKLPTVHLKKGRVPDLTNFDFDDLLS